MGEFLFLSRGARCLSRILAIPPPNKTCWRTQTPTVGRFRKGTQEWGEKTGKVLSCLFFLIFFSPHWSLEAPLFCGTTNQRDFIIF